MPEAQPLVRDAEYPEITAVGHRVAGTGLYILELLMFGAASASYYLLLRSPALLARLGEEAVRSALLKTPSRFGRHLTFGRDLTHDPATGTVSYLGPVRSPRTP